VIVRYVTGGAVATRAPWYEFDPNMLFQPNMIFNEEESPQ
jgi:hypothetical protein